MQTHEGPAVASLPYSPDEVARSIGPGWPELLRQAYRWMLLGRTLDARMVGLQRQGRIGFYGATTGQEAVCVGAGLASRAEDWVVPGLREQLLALVRGHPLETYAHHLFADSQDPAQGRQMPCHPTAIDVHYVSMSSVVGTQIPHGVGIAWGLKYRKAPGAVLTFFGDGATSANDFHAGLNFAGVFGLPVVFCCANNQWAISMPVERQTRVTHLADKASAYGFSGRRVDGTDLVAVYSAVTEARTRAARGEGPTLLEFLTYRMTPHSTSDDPTRYQAENWLENARTQDPVARLEAGLVQWGLLTEADRTQLMTEVDQEVRRAVESAEHTPSPDPSTLTRDVFAPRPEG